MPVAPLSMMVGFADIVPGHAVMFMEAEIYPSLLKGLTELCRTKPENPVEWLGHWLLDNVPGAPKYELP